MKQIKTSIAAIYNSYRGLFLPFLLSLFLLLGNSYLRKGDWSLCFGSYKQFALFLLLLCISSLTIKFLLGLGFKFLDYLSTPYTQYGFLQKHTLIKVMCVLLIFWSPYLIASLPGALCVDSQTQLNQVLGYSAYSLHHPMLHTLFMGICIKTGQILLHSANIGLAIYISIQALFLAFSLALSIWAMCRKHVHKLWIYSALVFYCITPLFGYYASLAIKDTPFNSAFLIFMVCFILLWEKAPMRFLPYLLTISAVLVCQFRNNGIYTVGFMAFLLLVLLFKRSLTKEHFHRLLLPITIAILLHFTINICIAIIYQPLSGYSREMLSIFMQQTARYASNYGYDVTPEELAVLENIFGNTEALVQNYNPHLSDPIKNMFKMDASFSEIISYLNVWFAQFWRHPDAYFEAFFHGSFGWFYPFVDNASRYYDPGFIFSKPAFTAGIEEVVSRWYDFFRQIPLLNLLQNVGLYTWLMFASLSYAKRRNLMQRGIYFAPLLLSLMICLAAPAFFQHARYGFPILFCIPFLIGIITSPHNSNVS